MGKQTLLERFRQWIASIGWKLFLWGNRTTAEQYWGEIYEQERMLISEQEPERSVANTMNSEQNDGKIN